MSELDNILAANRAAVDDLLAAAAKSASVWTTPRAPGHWSPSQVVEHVARALEQSANVVTGAPDTFPKLPAFLRPVLRVLFFNRVLKKNAFPKAKTNKAMNPSEGPAAPAQARPRLEGALTAFTEACRAHAKHRESITSAAFGMVTLGDFARFQEIHTRHHIQQMPRG